MPVLPARVVATSPTSVWDSPEAVRKAAYRGLTWRAWERLRGDGVATAESMRTRPSTRPKDHDQNLPVRFARDGA